MPMYEIAFLIAEGIIKCANPCPIISIANRMIRLSQKRPSTHGLEGTNFAGRDITEASGGQIGDWSMALPNIFDLCTPRDDVAKGRCCTKNSRVATRPCPLALGDTHRNRPTQFVHAVESFDGYSGFGLALRMAARSQRVADNALVAADLHLDF